MLVLEAKNLSYSSRLSDLINLDQSRIYRFIKLLGLYKADDPRIYCQKIAREQWRIKTDLSNPFTLREKELQVKEGVGEKSVCVYIYIYICVCVCVCVCVCMYVFRERETKESNVTKAKKEDCLVEGIVSAFQYCRKLQRIHCRQT